MKTTKGRRERVLLAILGALFPNVPVASDKPTTSYLYEYDAESESESEQIVAKAIYDIDHALPLDSKKQLNLLLYLLSTRIGSLLLLGLSSLKPFPTPFHLLPLATRQATLSKWAQHEKMMRLAFKAFKGILLRALFTQLPENDKLISSLGYPPHYPPSCDGDGNGNNDKEKEEGKCGHSNNTIRKSSLQAETRIKQSLVDLQGVSTIEEAVEGLKRQFPSVTVVESSKQKSTSTIIVVNDLDAVIVGSGPGGSITAYNLSQAGMKVAVLEKSTFVSAIDLPMTERQAFERLYEAHGLLSSEDASISILAGSTLGGGSRVNWCASFKTPDHVLKEWAGEKGGGEGGGGEGGEGGGDSHLQQHQEEQSEGLQKMFGSPEYKQGLDSVCKRLGVRTGFNHSTNCTLLAQGLENMAADCEDVPRNCGDDDCSGLCQFGCGRGEKQDAVVTYLADACGSGSIGSGRSGGGAKIVTGVMADVVMVENVQDEKATKRATGIVAKTTIKGICIIFKAPIVIISAGAIHTPALLLRSKITVDVGGVQGIGSNLRLHPCTVIIAKFDNDDTEDSSHPHPQSQSQPAVVQAWNGPIMSKYSTQLAEWNGSGYGAVVYNVSPHPGMFAAGLPWKGNVADMKRMLADFEKSVFALVLVRDRGSGKVKIDGAGAPRIVYALAEEDKETMLGGMKLACRALKAAGATALSLINGQEYQFKKEKEKKMDNGIGNNIDNNDGDKEFEHWLNTEMTVPDRDLLCAHQMGTAALGRVLDGGTGECKSVSGLYVCDASCFPTSLGVNPMITVYGIANMISNGIARGFLGKKKETERGVHHQLAYEQKNDDDVI